MSLFLSGFVFIIHTLNKILFFNEKYTSYRLEKAEESCAGSVGERRMFVAIRESGLNRGIVSSLWERNLRHCGQIARISRSALPCRNGYAVLSLGRNWSPSGIRVLHIISDSLPPPYFIAIL